MNSFRLLFDWGLNPKMRLITESLKLWELWITSKKVKSRLVILMDPEELMNCKGALGWNRTKEKRYAFDHAFDKDCGQTEIFKHTTKFLVEGVLHGYNATVFAYGATGAGKTYTMIGTAENPGNMFMTLKHLFTKMNEMKKENMYSVRVSFLEIYN